MEWQSFVVIGLILGAAVISVEFGISVSILEILAGVLAANFVGVEETSWMAFLSNFGLLGLMFFAGFEIDLPLLKKHWRGSTSLGLSSFFIPFGTIFLASQLFLKTDIQPSLLIALGMATTSLPLVYSVLRQQKNLDHNAIQVFLGGAMLIDVMSIIMLEVLFEGFRLSSFILLLIVLCSLPVLPEIGRWMFNRYGDDDVELKMRYVLLVLLALAIVSTSAGVHDALLAFLAGFVFSKLLAEQHGLEEKLRGIVFGLLAPVFFFQAGSSLDFANLTLDVFGAILLFFGITYTTKYLSTYLVGRQFFVLPIARLSGTMFNFQLTFGAIIALFGLQHGMIDATLYTFLLSVVLLTSFTAAIVVQRQLKEA